MRALRRLARLPAPVVPLGRAAATARLTAAHRSEARWNTAPLSRAGGSILTPLPSRDDLDPAAPRSPGGARRLGLRRALHRQDAALRLLPLRHREGGARQPRTASASRATGPAAARTCSTRPNLGKYLLRGASTRRTNRDALVARLRQHLRRVGDDRRGEASAGARSTSRSAFPSRKERVQLVLEKRARRRRRSARSVLDGRSIRASRFVDRSPIAARGEVDRALRERPARAQGRPARARRRLRGAARRRSSRRDVAAPHRRPVRDRALQARTAATSTCARCSCPRPRPGISNPRKGVWRDAPLGCSFNAFDSDRYVLTYANEALREAAAQAPYDALILLFNERKYGGGGIYNLWATVRVGHRARALRLRARVRPLVRGPRRRVLHLAGRLRGRSTRSGVEPWEPNVTALLDPAKLKWKDLVAQGTPLPTPWDQGRLRRDRPRLPGEAQGADRREGARGGSPRR